ncbi:NAD(P)-binding domain-containing protein [Paenirhodobacter sp.]|uniref:NAD(P)-binding domain-containing protein n=1 Tax=Paenirhodobacter sp. TaxID=1965326 RepID=UPI003B409FF1
MGGSDLRGPPPRLFLILVTLARAGHDVAFSYSRSTAKLTRLASEAGGRTGTVAQAVEGADAVLLAAH